MNQINPDDFITWLITQQNARGSLYLERVAHHYVRYLRTSPPKLDMAFTTDERDIFACASTKKFAEMRNAFLSAPNYKVINGEGHQSFSAGMNAYMRYLESLEAQGENVNIGRPSKRASLVGEVPSNLLTVLTENYSGGVRFEATLLRLLSDKSGVVIDNRIQNVLKHIMFRRSDDVFFLPDSICDTQTRKEIINVANSWIDDYGCFELSELYALFKQNINSRCIDNLENFTAFYEFINRRDIRCVECYRTRIARIKRSIKDLFSDIAMKIGFMAYDEYGGTVDEDVSRKHFPAFSTAMIATIIKEYAEELVKTEINGLVCYQTLGALGLSDEFTEVLVKVLEQIEALALVPSEEVLHTALSICLGVNFKLEYNIPDDKTYRRLIEIYYKDAPKRKWLRGIFAEVLD